MGQTPSSSPSVSAIRLTIRASRASRPRSRRPKSKHSGRSTATASRNLVSLREQDLRNARSSSRHKRSGPRSAESKNHRQRGEGAARGRSLGHVDWLIDSGPTGISRLVVPLRRNPRLKLLERLPVERIHTRQASNRSCRSNPKRGKSQIIPDWFRVGPRAFPSLGPSTADGGSGLPTMPVAEDLQLARCEHFAIMLEPQL